MSIISNSSICFKSIIADFSRLRIFSAVLQIREKGHLNRPHLRNPIWLTKKNRVFHNDYITSENKEFLNEVVHDKYGPPAIIKGTQSFQNAASKGLVNVDEYEKKEWKQGMRRTGLLARKIGQYPLWLKNGQRIRTTLLQVVDNHVIKYIPPNEYHPTQKPRVKNTQRFGCLMVGAESVDPSTLTKEYCGLFNDSGVMPKKHLARFLVSPEAAIPPGTPLNATHFRVGDIVDVRGQTVDRGFQGVCYRHGFKGMPASHGVTKTHRRPGNIGGGGEKGRVWPGTRLPGHMGNRWRMQKGLKIWRINTKYNVMWVQGSAIAGLTNSLVYIYDTILPLKKLKTAPPFPTCFEEELTEPLPDDIWLDEVHNFKNPSIVFAEDKN